MSDEIPHEKLGTDPANTIDMKPERAMCSVHMEPFRSKWPLGFPVMMVHLFERVCGNKTSPADAEAFLAEGRRLLGLPELAKDEQEPDAIRIIHACLDAKPMCCRVPKKVLEDLYEESTIAQRHRCSICGRTRLGSPFTASNVGRLEHLCFNCLVHRTSSTPWGN